MLSYAYRSMPAVAVSALVATAVTILPPVNDRVVASTPIHGGKGDRLDIRPLGTQCSELAWPYFEAKCIRDPRLAHGEARPVRIVTRDRIMFTDGSGAVR
jgi:hypothetical protein